jgi:hypothetical protein
MRAFNSAGSVTSGGSAGSAFVIRMGGGALLRKMSGGKMVMFVSRLFVAGVGGNGGSGWIMTMFVFGGGFGIPITLVRAVPRRSTVKAPCPSPRKRNGPEIVSLAPSICCTPCKWPNPGTVHAIERRLGRAAVLL